MSDELGKFSIVPCVRAKYYNRIADWPVIGPMHDDKEHLNFPYLHYHIDWRFVPAPLFKPLGFNFSSPLMTSDRLNVGGLPKPVMRRRKMQRLLQDFHVPHTSQGWRALEQAYSTCRLKPGLVCPHRGVPLDGGHREGDVVTCPAHGLRWNVKTGELVPQSPIIGAP